MFGDPERSNRTAKPIVRPKGDTNSLPRSGDSTKLMKSENGKLKGEKLEGERRKGRREGVKRDKIYYFLTNCSLFLHMCIFFCTFAR